MLRKFLQIVRTWTAHTEDDDIVTLVQVALDDAALGDQLLARLSLPQTARARRLHQWQAELRDEGAPEELLTILARLEDEKLANQTYLVLQKVRNAG